MHYDIVQEIVVGAAATTEAALVWVVEIGQMVHIIVDIPLKNTIGFYRGPRVNN